MEKINLASMEFKIQWKSSYAVHIDRHFVDKVHFWRDIFPGKLDSHGKHLTAGETYIEEYDAGVLVAPFDQQRIKTVKINQFVNNDGDRVSPKIGKFYPQGWAWRALNCFPPNTQPFRVIERDKELFVADSNHPLCRYPLTLEAQVIDTWEPTKERGGECKDISSILTGDGPGMQIPHQWATQDCYSPYPFHRKNDDDDSIFYHNARLINHLDDTAIEQIKLIHSRLLSPRNTILDLMSSWTSHLPDTYENCQITGLGLNEEELRANPRLANTVVHDLNQLPRLPFPDNTFDAVICTSSIEYLTQPLEILAEIARITISGGIFITTFSDRWFPGKEITPWADLHSFERLGLVLDYYLKTRKFENIHTESIIGLPRPPSDKHIVTSNISDPVFAVWANIKWP
ncbi:methyltransferase domain-containing protein [Desulforhopalus sp. 52FAK]